MVAFLGVLVIAAGLRFYRLPERPVGFHYDEAANGILAGEIARGIKTPVFISSYTGKEVLFFYWAALCMKLLGVTPLGLRFAAALMGVATVVATVWAIHEVLGNHPDAPWLAIVVAAFLATSFWHLVLSRYGFRAVAQPLLQALTVAALWRGLRDDHRAGPALASIAWLLVAGFFCGLTAYTYLASRAFPIPLAAALLALVVTDREGRRRLAQLAIFVAAAVVVLAPLGHYWLTHPGSFVARARQVAADSWAEVWDGALACLRMLFLRGDPYIRFNLPGRPLFGPIVAGLFVLGCAAAVWRLAVLSADRGSSSSSLSAASYVFLLVSVPVMLLPSALATAEITPSNLRAVGLLPFAYALPALGLSTLRAGIQRAGEWSIGHLDGLARGRAVGRKKAARPTGGWQVPYWVLVILLLGLCAPPTATAYFRDWAPSAALYDAADGDLAAVSRYLDHVDLTSTRLYVASQHYRHPTLAFLAEDYEEIRWLTAGRTLVFPAQRDGLFVFPRSASQDLAWVRLQLPGDSLVGAPPGPEGAPAFHVFRIGSSNDSRPPQPKAANLGDVVQLLGYSILEEGRSGENVEIGVWWEVLDDPDRQDYRPVVRLADRWGFVWGEAQPFHYPSEQWSAGEVVADHLSIPVAPGAPPGDYVVRFALYSPGADVRLPVLDDGGAYAGTYVQFPVHLARAKTASPIERLGIRRRLDVEVDGLTLLGANLDATSVRPGEPLQLTLFWRADEAGPSAYRVSLDLGDTSLYDGAPAHGTYPFSKWASGEIVADRYNPRLPLDAPGGRRRLQVWVGETRVDLGDVTVEEVDRSFEIPPMPRRVGVRIGERIELLGYDLSADPIAPAEALRLTLYWRALTEMSTDYTIFTHLLAPDGSMTGQQDGEPVGGTYQTTLWLPGEVITDRYEIAVRPDAVPGEHRLEVGLYVADTGARLPVEDSPHNAVVLQTITVAE